MKIARVFAQKKSSFTPTDQDCYFGSPGCFTPVYDEVHVSCVFTWDKPYAEWLAFQWQNHGIVKIGGPAYKSPCIDFIPGRYVAPGIIFTTRGCPNKCHWPNGRCLVPELEGEFRELPITPGNIIQDNNVLASSESHWDNLCAMLRTQSRICFKGGIEARRLTDKRILDLRSLSIDELWLACDTPGALPRICDKIKQLRRAGFSQDNILVYALCGNDMEEEARMEQIYLSGGLPFSMLYQPPEQKIEYSPIWKDFQRDWSRPEIFRGKMNDLFKWDVPF